VSTSVIYYPRCVIIRKPKYAYILNYYSPTGVRLHIEFGSVFASVVSISINVNSYLGLELVLEVGLVLMARFDSAGISLNANRALILIRGANIMGH